MRSYISLVLISALAIGCKKPVPVEPAVAVPTTAEPAPVRQVPPHVEEMRANFEKVFFAFDSSDLDDASKQALTDNVTLMQKHPELKVEAQGHCDERGTTEYNLALGDRRASNVQRYMSALGISPDRVATISYGEERPLNTNDTEVAWGQNRRAEFRITWSQGTSVSGTTQ